LIASAAMALFSVLDAIATSHGGPSICYSS
jgi:hypothetical protein